MKYLLIAILKYLHVGNKEIILTKDIKTQEGYFGIQLTILVYHFYNIFNVSVTKRVFWKPFKRVISEEALPSLWENNKKGKDPYVNVWFELEEDMIESKLFSVKMIGKIKQNSSMHYVLENIIKNTKKFK